MTLVTPALCRQAYGGRAGPGAKQQGHHDAVDELDSIASGSLRRIGFCGQCLGKTLQRWQQQG
jgi:hypothetical protein